MRYRYIIPIVFLAFFAFGASADTLNQKVTFNIDPNFDADKGTTVQATLWGISDNAYFYVSDEYTRFLSSNDKFILTNRLKNLGEEFENNIYPTLTGFWGSEPNPGVDSDPHITILITKLVNYAGGYFDTIHSFSKDQAAESNERDMVYMNTLALDELSGAYEFLAHEFQHLVSLNQKGFIHGAKEDIWLNEVRSEYSVTLVGYNDVFRGSNLQRRVRAFVENPSISLTEVNNVASDYAQVALFAEYVADKYGPLVLSQSLRSPKVGTDSFPNFDEIFKNWMIANYLNDKKINDFYGYDRADLINFKIQPTKSTGILLGSSVLIQTQVKDWQPQWYELRDFSDGVMRIDFSGDVGERFSLSYIAFWDDRTVTTGDIDLIGNKVELYVDGIEKIVLMPIKKTRTSGFSRNEPRAGYNIVARGVSEAPINAKILTNKKITAATSNALGDGSLIKLQGGKDIYVIDRGYKRLLLSEIIKMYGHLNPSAAIEVPISVFNSYKTSNYVRYVDDKKVYAVWPDGTKHWFNMAGDYFIASGRSFDAIFIVNENEILYYRTGSDVVK